MPYQYAYITGCLILFLFWLFIFLKRKDLQKEMLWASICGMPFGFIDFFLIPTYWNPDSLFDLAKRFGVGIESFIFAFIVTGIASVIYEFIEKEKPVKMTSKNVSHFWLIITIIFSFVLLSILFPSKAVYNLMIVGAVGAIITIYLRRDLWKQILASAFIFSFLYFGVFVLVNLMFKGLVENFYVLENTWGILVLGVPLEEIAVAFSVGAFWSTIYEYTKSYREKKIA